MQRRSLARRLAAAFALTLTAVVGGASSSPVTAADGTLVITGVVDGPLTGGVPKVIELFAQTDIPDLGAFGIEVASNGNASEGSTEFDFPSDSVSAGTYLYLASEAPEFTAFFGFAPDYTSSVALINGDDAILLYEDGVAVDHFGVAGEDGSGTPWEYLDGWAKRADVNDAPTTAFAAGDWTFSGANALDGETTNATAATPFPLGRDVSDPGPEPVLVINEIDYDQVGSDAAEYVEITNTGDASADLSTASLVFVNGSENAIYDTIPLGGSLAPGDHYVVCANAATVANCDLDDGPDTNFVQNGAPDAVALLVDGLIVDTVSYEGDVPGYTEGTGGAPADSNTVDGSISRCPDGADTDQNDVDFVFAVTPTPGVTNDCDGGDPDPEIVLISAVQGSGSAVALGGVVTVEAIVTADFQGGDQLRGFFLQEEDADSDGDAATSEGIFVFCSSCPVDVAVGDLVQVTGSPSEFFGMSQITASFATDIVVTSSGNPLPTPATIDLPATAGSTRAETTFESNEGMLVTFSDTMVVSEYFELARYGHLVLNAESRARQFTDANEPSVAGYATFLDDLNASRIYLDDDNNRQNDAIDFSDPTNDTPYFWPRPGLSNTNLIRGGDSIDGLTGVLHWSFAGQSGTDAWRVRPVEEAFTYDFTSNSARSEAPDDVGGTLKVASFNVLNYFTTIDSRGADSIAELDRQRAKIADAICAMDADVVGLIEIENNGSEAIADLLDGAGGVNEGCGEYEFVDTGGPIGTDAIAVAFIYRPDTVGLAGGFAVLDSSVDPRFDDDRNRPALAQTFTELATGADVTVVVNHLKSKGSSCAGDGDPDVGDGQGNCNLTRTAAAEAMVDWLAGDPTAAGADNVLIIGDLNAYRNEDPIDAIEAGADDTAGTADDYVDLLDDLIGASAYTYVFDGQLGYLDHALANSALAGQVTGVTAWNINADEIPVFDYNDDVRDAGEQSFERESSAEPIYEPNASRSSDHDPVIVGLDLNGAPVCSAAEASIPTLWAPNHRLVLVEVVGVTDPDGDEVSITIDGIMQDEPVDDRGTGNTEPDASGVGAGAALVRAERSGRGDGRVYHISFTATDGAGASCSGTVQVEVPRSRNGASAVDDGPLFDATAAS